MSMEGAKLFFLFRPSARTWCTAIDDYKFDATIHVYNGDAVMCFISVWESSNDRIFPSRDIRLSRSDHTSLSSFEFRPKKHVRLKKMRKIVELDLSADTLKAPKWSNESIRHQKNYKAVIKKII